MTRKNTFFAFLFFTLLSPTLWAQTNDECSGATVISDPSDFCTTAPGDDNTSASTSPQAFPSCWPNFGADLWYSFTAVAEDLVVIVKGFTPSNPSGTMQGPLISVYSGDCNNLVEVGCAIGLVNNVFVNNLPLQVSGLVVGQQYFIRIDGVVPGLFELCIQNNENANVVSGDCPTSTVVSCTTPIEVDQVFGPGVDPSELSDAPCLTGFPGESSAAWYVFTAANNAKLTFTITPNDPNDDIDFVLYRLPNGPSDCTDKVSERCMVAGDFGAGSPCMGPTGLNLTATDINQPPGCAPGMDNFLRFLTLVPGRTYALCINNFTTVGNGFTLEWGQDIQFENGDVKAIFSTDEPDKKLCLGEELVVTYSSYSIGGMLTEWHWDFGGGSVPDTIGNQGPHTVQYQTVGPKQIILTVKNDVGCISRDTALVLVEICCAIESEVSVVPGCPVGPPSDAVATVDVQNSLDPLTITWSNGQTGSSETTDIDTSGTYYVLIEDANGCKDSTSFIVTTPLNVSAVFPPDTTILEGESITLTVTGVTTDSLSVSWDDLGNNEPPLTGPTQALNPTETTTYLVTVINSGCEFSDSVTIVVDKLKYDRPNAFTPNGDGANDTFGPVLVGHTLVQLEVWSRWGEKIFDSISDGSKTWDGKINGEVAPSDVYVYRMRIRLLSGEEKIEKGDVTLLR
ncbi:MAG: gliding motility-associated C-terminal domain-containing protein [Lewinellaceae bacterium]|nr:gliding motility-associated C-terminal domain-containing protein [Lewinellaceae bacterium]